MAKVINCADFLEPLTNGEKVFLDSVKNSCLSDNWEVFFQPHMNGKRPDFILINHNVGVIIVEVKDWNLECGRYRDGGQILGNDGRWKTKNPDSQVLNYKNIIIEECCYQSYDELIERHSNAYSIIETAIFFHGESKQNSRKFCGIQNNYIKIIDDINVRNIMTGDFKNCGINQLQYETSRFDKILVSNFVKELRCFLIPSEYSQERKNPITLGKNQREYAKVWPKSHRRLSGVAGSGKSLVIASKAANLIAADKKVLILTFNITLAHYLQDLVKQQYQGNDYNLISRNLVVIHFHGFMRLARENLEIELVDKTVDVNNSINCTCDFLLNTTYLSRKYMFDAILVDEGQDFKDIWLKAILKFLHKDNDELLVVYDKVQDIYSRNSHIWLESGTSGFGFRGKAGNLPETHRLPLEMVNLLNKFCRIYGLDNFIQIKEEANAQQTLDYDFAHKLVDIRWINIDNSTSIDILLQMIKILISNGVHTNDIAIITFSEDTGVEIVEMLNKYGYRCSHVYDMNKNTDYDEKIKERRRNKKKFWGNSGTIHVCSVHSYKGWECNHLIICMLEENIPPNLLYVALSRLKSSLYKFSNCMVINNTNNYKECVKLFEDYNLK